VGVAAEGNLKMGVEFKVVIPARYGSTRLPGKPLLQLAGFPMIWHVYQRGAESRAHEVVVATDDERIAEAVGTLGGRAVMTSANHRSGSDRIGEVIAQLGWHDDAIVVNLQGDEPCMPPRLIDQLAMDLASQGRADVATVAAPIAEKRVLFDPHVVKVVCDAEGFALYFSRAPIPWHRDEFLARSESLPSETPFLRHIGLYAYRAGFLRRYVEWRPSALENAESLEQLRILWHGFRIHVCRAAEEPAQGVDTPADLSRAEAVLKNWNRDPTLA